MLTGVGRFNEMSYIFDTLFEHEYFELLCRKGIEKVTYCFLLKNVLIRIFVFSPILVFCRLVACAADEPQPLVKSVCEPELKSLFRIPTCVPGFTVKAGQAYPPKILLMN